MFLSDIFCSSVLAGKERSSALPILQGVGVGGADLIDDLADDAGDALVEYLAHDEIEEALLVAEEHGGVGRVPGQVVERIGGTA